MSDASALGALVAGTLAGSWRSEPPALDLAPDKVARVAPLLLATGTGGLGWWRLARAASAGGEHGRALHDAFRLQTLDASLHARRLTRAVEVLSEAGVEFALAKGWAVARLYARPGLRPYGDLDVFVAPEHHARTLALKAAHEGENLRLDVHSGVPLLRRSWSAIRKRVRLVGAAGVSVPMLGDEDHLTLLCVHMFFHGAWRPTWLCDIAAFVETLPEGFDWDRVGLASRRQRRLCRATVLLAGRLLGADLCATPWAEMTQGGESAQALPRWLTRAVLRAWGRGGHYSVTTPIGSTEPHPRVLFHALRVRWPNPVEATFRWHAPVNGLPRLPFQILDVMARGARLLAPNRPDAAR